MPSKQQNTYLNRFGPPLLLSVVFLSLTIPNIGSPPLDGEEAWECLIAHRLVSTPVEQADPMWIDLLPGFQLFNRHLPLMEDTPYVGALELYLQLPFSALLGINAFSLRIMPILFTLLGLLAAYAVCSAWFGRRAAFVGLLLTMTHPIVVHFTREGHAKEEIFTVTFFWIGLWFIHKYFNSQGRRGLLLFLGMLMFGLGMSHKITFLWYLAGLAAAVLLHRLRPFDGSLPKAKHLLLGAAGFLIGSIFFILGNIENHGEIFRLMAYCLINPTPKDAINNMDVFYNLYIRFRQLGEVILRGELWDPVWVKYVKDRVFLWNHLQQGLFLVGYVVVLLLALRHKGGAGDPLRRSRTLALFTFFSTVFFCSAFTIVDFNPSHLLVIYPFPQIVIALLLGHLTLLPGPRKVWSVVGVVMVLAMLGFNVYLTVGYHQVARSAVQDPYDPWKPYTGARAGRQPAKVLPPTMRWQ